MKVGILVISFFVNFLIYEYYIGFCVSPYQVVKNLYKVLYIYPSRVKTKVNHPNNGTTKDLVVVKLHK